MLWGWWVFVIDVMETMEGGGLHHIQVKSDGGDSQGMPQGPDHLNGLHLVKQKDHDIATGTNKIGQDQGKESQVGASQPNFLAN